MEVAVHASISGQCMALLQQYPWDVSRVPSRNAMSVVLLAGQPGQRALLFTVVLVLGEMPTGNTWSGGKHSIHGKPPYEKLRCEKS